MDCLCGYLIWLQQTRINANQKVQRVNLFGRQSLKELLWLSITRLLFSVIQWLKHSAGRAEGSGSWIDHWFKKK